MRPVNSRWRVAGHPLVQSPLPVAELMKLPVFEVLLRSVHLLSLCRQRGHQHLYTSNTFDDIACSQRTVQVSRVSNERFCATADKEHVLHGISWQRAYAYHLIRGGRRCWLVLAMSSHHPAAVQLHMDTVRR